MPEALVTEAGQQQADGGAFLPQVHDPIPLVPDLPPDDGRPADAPPRLALCVHLDMHAVAGEWRTLSQAGDGTPFQTYQWLSHWQDSIGAPSGVRPLILIWRDEFGRAQILLPLAIEPGPGTARLVFLGHELNDYNAPVLASGLMERLGTEAFLSLWQSALQRLHLRKNFNCHMVLLDKMPMEVGNQPNPLALLPTILNPSSAHGTALGATWDSFYAAKRSSATRQSDRRKLKKLSEVAVPQIRHAGTAEDIDATLAALFAQKRNWFAKIGIPDLFAKPGHREFYLSVAKAHPDLVHVSRLDVAGTCAAANLGLLFKDRYYYILTSYDDGPLSRWGTGALHLHRIMAYAISRACTYFDFTIGDESYKRDWEDAAVTLHDHIRGIGWRGRITAALICLVREIKRQVKSNPVLHREARRIRKILLDVRARRA